MTNSTFLAAIPLLLASTLTSGPASAQPLAFEVASVKPAPPPTGPGISVGISTDKGRLTMSNVSLKIMVVRAYRLKEQQVQAPDWMSNTRFDVAAKLPPGGKEDQIPEMLQALLAERFLLKIHKEQKIAPIYGLVAAKGGTRLKPSEGDDSVSLSVGSEGRKLTGKATLARLADALSSTVDRPVVDMTDVKGTYELDLSWSPEEVARPDGSGPLPDAPTIFTALQEKMGLKLEALKVPMDLIVVDHAEKTPTEN